VWNYDIQHVTQQITCDQRGVQRVDVLFPDMLLNLVLVVSDVVAKTMRD